MRSNDTAAVRVGGCDRRRLASESDHAAAHRCADRRRGDEGGLEPVRSTGRRPRRGTRSAVPRSPAGRLAQASDVVEHPRVRARCLVRRRIDRFADQHSAVAAGACGRRRSPADPPRATPQAAAASADGQSPNPGPVRISVSTSRWLTLFLDDQPALHLEVQRRAELGAVEAVGARLVGHELDRRRLARDRD